MARTVKQTLQQVQELKQQAAVYQSGADWLHTRYISRDSAAAISQISCDGAPVPEEVIELVIENLKGQAKEMKDAADSFLGLGVDRG